MAHVFELTDEQYARLEAAARERGETPKDLFQSWLDSIGAQPTRECGWGDVTPPTEEEMNAHPLLRVAGMFTIGEPRWTEYHDEAFGGEVERSNAQED